MNTPEEPIADQIQWLNSISCCGGEPPPNAMRADDQRWPGNHIPQIERRDQVANALVNIVFCPTCFRIRIHPGHWLLSCSKGGTA